MSARNHCVICTAKFVSHKCKTSVSAVVVQLLICSLQNNIQIPKGLGDGQQESHYPLCESCRMLLAKLEQCKKRMEHLVGRNVVKVSQWKSNVLTQVVESNLESTTGPVPASVEVQEAACTAAAAKSDNDGGSANSSAKNGDCDRVSASDNDSDGTSAHANDSESESDESWNSSDHESESASDADAGEDAKKGKNNTISGRPKRDPDVRALNSIESGPPPKFKLIQLAPHNYMYGGWKLKKFGDTFICVTCQHATVGEMPMRRHVQLNHQLPGRNSAVCEICGLKCKTETGLKFHKAVKHEKTATPGRPASGKPRSSGSGGKHHRLKETAPGEFEYRNMTVSKVPNGFKCGTCGLIIAEKSKVLDHLYRRHTQPFLKMCEHCGKTFHNKTALKTHLDTHKTNRTKPYMCETCGKPYYTQEQLNSHRKQVHLKIVLRNFDCKDCGKKFRCKSQLESHMFRHTKVPKFKCEECGKVYASYTALYIHRNSHTGRRTYECDICEMKFSQAYSVKRHKMVVHNNEEAETRLKGYQLINKKNS